MEHNIAYGQISREKYSQLFRCRINNMPEFDERIRVAQTIRKIPSVPVPAHIFTENNCIVYSCDVQSYYL